MNHIHVISFQNPTPPNYGGVIDVYYKLKALKKAGWTITLHTYNYHGRQQTRPDFFEENDKVIYYKRDESPLCQFGTLPYIVQSRRNPELLANLHVDSDPIFFEGLHTTYFLSDPSLMGRKKIVRTHNVEHDYYRGLARAEKRMWKRLYYRLEAWKLKRYEKKLLHADLICAISDKDQEYFQKEYPQVKTIKLCGFYDDSRPDIIPGEKEYVLYQGSLDVAENIEAVERILNRIAPKVRDIQFVIAGRNPSAELIDKVEGVKNVKLIANPDNAVFSDLLTQARVNLLLTEQATGVKLKFLHALCRGAHLVVNSKMTEGTGLDYFCSVADTDDEIVKALERKIREPYTDLRTMPPEYNTEVNIWQLEKELE